MAETIFNEIDKDENGKVSIAEFVQAYFEQQTQVEDRIEELKEMI